MLVRLNLRLSQDLHFENRPSQSNRLPCLIQWEKLKKEKDIEDIIFVTYL